MSTTPPTPAPDGAAPDGPAALVAADAPAIPWRGIIVSGYGPTLLASIGFGAVIPLITVRAIALGATVGEAAVVSAMLAIGQLVADLPAGAIAARLGEKRAMVLACLLDAAALFGIQLSHSLVALGVMVFLDGTTGAVFSLARQTYLTEAIPLRVRARALSTLGGVFRVGGFVGPLIGAAIVGRAGLSAAFVFASAMSLVAAAVTWLLPDLPDRATSTPQATAPTAPTGAASRVSTLGVARTHAGVLLTQGVGCGVLSLVRAARQSIVPLWCTAHGLSPATTSLVFALSMACDVLLFLPGGAIMDRFGRLWVVAPAMVVMGAGLLALPFTHGATSIAIVAAVLGLGNGTSSGIVMTLGSDASPALGRPQFLAAWRLLSDAGSTVGPLVITAVTAVSTLGASAVVLGLLSWAGAGWLGHWLRHPRPMPGAPASPTAPVG